MEISSKHWTARLIKFTFGADALEDIYDTCKYRSSLIWSFILLPVSILLLPFTALYTLFFKEWVGTGIGFVITFILVGVGFLLFTMFYAMWAIPAAFVGGIFCWMFAFIVGIGCLITHLKDQDKNVFKTLYHSYKEKYCKPIDFK